MAATWRGIADLLADRMYHHARCDEHPEADADPDNCPFCADRAAYHAWQAKSGQTHREPANDGGTLDVLAHARNSSTRARVERGDRGHQA